MLSYKISSKSVVRNEPDGIYVMTYDQQKEKITDPRQRKMFNMITHGNACDHFEQFDGLDSVLERWLKKGIIEFNQISELASMSDDIVSAFSINLETDEPIAEQHTSAPIYMTIGITSKCNCFCKHCGNDSQHEAYSDDLTHDEILALLDEACKIPLLKINFTGGEPTENHYLLEYISAVHGRIPRITMTSNGYNITDSCAKALRNAGCNMVKLSIDGMQNFHDNFRGLNGCWKHAMKAIGSLQKHGIEVRVQTTLTKHNAKDMFPLSEILAHKGVSHQTIVPVCPIGRAERDMMLAPEEYKLFLYDYCSKIAILHEQGYKTHFQVRPVFGEQNAFKNSNPEFETLSVKYSCEALQNTMEVRANGDVVPCSFLDRVIGNIRDDGLLKIWDSSFAADARRELHNVLDSSAVCRACERAGSSCNGGCYANATRSNCSCDPYCFAAPALANAK